MTSKISLTKIILIIFQIIVVTALAYFLIATGGIDSKISNKQQSQSVAILTAETVSPPFPIAETRIIETPINNPFTNLNLTARGVIVYDINNDKIVFSQNKDNLLPIASLTKLMTIYTATKFLAPDAIITAEQEDLDLDTSSDLKIGERWNLKNLMAFTLISSSNAGANAIAREAQKQLMTNFVSQMNETAKEIGLQNSYFRNVTGLDLPDVKISGAASTAHDIARLYSYIFKNNPEMLVNTNQSSLVISSLDNIKHQIINTNKITDEIPSLISSKTGTTDLAGGNLAVLFEPIPGRPMVVVLLGGTPDGRFADMEKLVKDTTRVMHSQ
jgi:serine-type D-Ala-D-Ala carboxypeptidase (penicillin-binding protein 5/6)